jgi:hypothetical protein
MDALLPLIRFAVPRSSHEGSGESQPRGARKKVEEGEMASTGGEEAAEARRGREGVEGEPGAGARQEGSPSRQGTHSRVLWRRFMTATDWIAEVRAKAMAASRSGERGRSCKRVGSSPPVVLKTASQLWGRGAVPVVDMGGPSVDPMA